MFIQNTVHYISNKKNFLLFQLIDNDSGFCGLSQNTNRIGSIEITKDEIKIGRKQDNDIQVIDIKISGYHWNIKKEGKRLINSWHIHLK